MNVLIHVLTVLVALALVYPTSAFILAFFGTGGGAVLFVVGLFLATVLALHNIRLTIQEYLILKEKKKIEELDTVDQKG